MSTYTETAAEKPQEGFVHAYAPQLHAFEFKNSSGHQSDKVVLFVGGLTNGLLDVPYLPALSRALNEIGWTLVQIIFSSSYNGWCTGSLQRDAQEISLLVRHLRSGKGGSRSKVILMGHSTGCQDTIQYLTKLPDKTAEIEIDAGILQAPVSDREVFYKEATKEEVAEMGERIKEYVRTGGGSMDEILPKRFGKYFEGVPISIYRYLSLSEVEGDDDFFSSDLSDEYIAGIFGKVTRPLLVLYSGKDQFPPEWVDKQKLIDRWRPNVGEYWSPLSKVVPGATHDIGSGSDAGAETDAISTVVEFIKSLKF